MSDLAAIAFSTAIVLVSCLATAAFHSWLKQRERERLTATDKAELTKRLDAVVAEFNGRVLELKNLSGQRR